MRAASTVTYGVLAVSTPPSICIFKYTRKSRSITDANKLNECRKIHKYRTIYKVPTVCFHLNWNWSPEQVQSESRASPTSTSPPTWSRTTQAEAEAAGVKPSGGKSAASKKTPVSSQLADSWQTRRTKMKTENEDWKTEDEGDFHCFLSL